MPPFQGLIGIIILSQGVALGCIISAFQACSPAKILPILLKIFSPNQIWKFHINAWSGGRSIRSGGVRRRAFRARV